MNHFLVFAAIVAIAYASVDCSANDGYFCNSNTNTYTWCAGGSTYTMPCAPGTACQCGDGNACSCTTVQTQQCETGYSSAQDYCQERLGQMAGLPQGYFCDALGEGFYQCVRDVFCPDKASPRSQFLDCADGTECRCGDTMMECSSLYMVTPCTDPSDYIPLTTQPLTTSPLTTQPLTTSPLTTAPLTTAPLTSAAVTSSPLTTSPLTSAAVTSSPLTTAQAVPSTTGIEPQTPHQANLCGNNRWDCINYSQGHTAHFCDDASCGNVGDGGLCAWNADTNTGVCVGDTYCSGAQSCHTASDCGSVETHACVINTCCGAAGICAPICSQ